MIRIDAVGARIDQLAEHRLAVANDIDADEIATAPRKVNVGIG
jgi:hypothetical protein